MIYANGRNNAELFISMGSGVREDFLGDGEAK